jgi:centrosomal protein CEP104
VNKYNLYNQVGLIAINCMGELGPQSDTSGASAVSDTATFEEEMQLDETSLERINALKKAKAMAVAADDYDEAQRLKEAIERLRSIGTHLAQLEERKRIACDKEDYAAAKIIKMEIDRLRETACNPSFAGGPYAP